MKLKNKVAIVTGGGRCIGRGIALALAEEGADIAIVETNSLDTAFNQYLDKNIHGFDSAQETVKEIKKLGRKAIALQADVSKWDQLKAAVDQAVAELRQAGHHGQQCRGDPCRAGRPHEGRGVLPDL